MKNKATAFEMETFDKKKLDTKKMLKVIQYNIELQKLLERTIYGKSN
jgi:hypothetical protein